MPASDIKDWHYAVTWDNADPADSKKMLADLAIVGRLTKIETQTTFCISPYKGKIGETLERP